MSSHWRTRPAGIEVQETAGSNTWLRVTLVEGKQNQIKRMFARIGHPVRKLRRISIGPVRLGKLAPGEVRELTPREVEQLRAASEKSSPRA